MQQECETVAILKSIKLRERERNRDVPVHLVKRAAERIRGALQQRGSTGLAVVS